MQKLRAPFKTLTACLLAGVLAYLALLSWRAYPDMKREYQAKTCSSLGALDATQTFDNTPSNVRIIGWVADRAGVERVELVSGNVLLFTVIPNAPRSDVRQVFPACSAGMAKGFDVPIELDKLGVENKDLSLYAVTRGGNRYKVGVVPTDVPDLNLLYQDGRSERLSPVHYSSSLHHPLH